MVNAEIQAFKNEQFGTVRTIERDGEPWFVAADVCKALEIKNSRDALARLDEDEKGVVSTDTLGGKQNLATVNEAGLYALVLGSRKPEAKQFKRWITHEVIPSIRKHGTYMTPETIEAVLLNPDTVINLATQLKAEQEKRRALESENAEMKPKALFADAVSASESSILIGDLAKLLRQNGVDIGQKRLFAWMRENGFLIRQGSGSYNMPTQKAMDMGLFDVKETVITHSDGRATVSKTTKVTGKGQVYFINKLTPKAPKAEVRQ